MVTAETAMVLPFLVALALALVWATTVAITQVRLVDAAREGARMAARGDARDDVLTGVRAMAPDDADIDVVEDADATTRVVVEHDARVDLPILRSFSMHLSATAVSATEGDAP
jgi:Flp pilus assembly protein TadG